MTTSRTDKDARLKAALRDNLRKRKAQERETSGPRVDPDGSAPTEG